MDHVVVILVQRDLYFVLCGPPLEWEDSTEGQGHRTTGDFRVGPQCSKNENKGTTYLENWPVNFLRFSRVWQWHVFRDLGQTAFEGLWSTEHDLVVILSMFTNTFWNIYIAIATYIKIKLWTAGQEHWSTRRTFFQVPWHRGLPMACQWRVWFLKRYFENGSYAKSKPKKIPIYRIINWGVLLLL